MNRNADNTGKDYYVTLGVLPSIDDVALAAVYRALLKKYHPDVFDGQKEEAERRTREVVEAYRMLGNSKSRLDYDNTRKAANLRNDTQDDLVDTEPYIPEEWTDLNRHHAKRMDKAFWRTIVIAALAMVGIIVLASVGQQQHPAQPIALKQTPAPTVALQAPPSQAPSVAKPECAIPPMNGTVMIFTSSPGPNVFQFVNKRSGNAIVKIRDDASGNIVASFFVSAGSESSFDQLPNGTFRIQYALGGNLAQDCHSFVHAYAIYQVPGAETFMSKRGPDGIIYHKLTYTLFAEASRDGNSRPQPIDAAAFDAK
jgi:hypothetical protein